MTITAKPILFSAPMIKALLREIANPGTGKTQTRRIIKQANIISGDCNDVVRPFGDGTYFMSAADGTHMTGQFSCPYGKPGDLLYVRETYIDFGRLVDFGAKYYRADSDEELEPYYKWTPSIHMPRWASRITLEITNVVPQRIQDISEEDAKAEGVERLHDGWFPYGIQTFMTTIVDGREVPAQYCREAKGSFRMLWESINGPESWKSNDWVWAVSFKPHLINVDRFIKERAAA